MVDFMTRSFAALGAGVVLSGCAGLEFHNAPEGSLTFRDSVPYMLVSTTPDCVTTGTIVSVPGAQRSVAFKSGYGTADLSVALNNGVVTAVGQKTDTKIPETITVVAGLAKDVGGLMTLKAAEDKPKATQCVPQARLYGIQDGLVGTKSLEFPITAAH
jgi:hypothetical protein